MYPRKFVNLFFYLFLAFNLFPNALHAENLTSTPTKYKIGIILPLSGMLATYGEALKWGVELAVGSSKDSQIVPV